MRRNLLQTSLITYYFDHQISMQWKPKQVILYCLKNEQECIKLDEKPRVFKPDNTRLRVF